MLTGSLKHRTVLVSARVDPLGARMCMSLSESMVSECHLQSKKANNKCATFIERSLAELSLAALPVK
eukprot:4310147-Amphidinium_carterae.1